MTTSAIKRGRKSAPTVTPAVTTEKPLVDRFGNRHSEAAMQNWSPAAIKALGLHRDDEGGADERAD